MDPSKGGRAEVEAAAADEFVLLDPANTVLFERVGAGNTAEVEHLRHSVMVINSAVTTDESHRARKKKIRMLRSDDLKSLEGGVASFRIGGPTYEVSNATIPCC